ncbi:hypothetical protein [Luteolibacter soli]
MKKRVAAALILLVALLCLYRGADLLVQNGNTTAKTTKHPTSSSPIPDGVTDSPHLPTKASNRPPTSGIHATHSPERLKEFFLPEVTIDGLPLKAALTKLLAAYQDVCRESGEVPLHLTFIVPPEATRPLTAKTGIRNLDSSIHLLAAIAGLKVSRSGSEYTFTAPEETGEIVKRGLQVPPDFFSRESSAEAGPFAEPAVIPEGMSFSDYLATLGTKEAHIATGAPNQLAPADYFASKGITLDPSTSFSLSGSTLQFTTTSAADQIAIEGLIDATLSNPPLQHKMETRLINIPAGMDWTPPDLSQLDDTGAAQMMRQLSQLKGVDLMSTPAITARVGEDAKVEIIHEILVPSPTAPGGFETQPSGLIVDFRAAPYGFGHHVDLNYSERIAEGESGTATAKVTERTAIADSSFSSDGNAQMHIQTHPDGTRSVVLVTPTLIDATGRPLHPKE